MGTGTLHQLWRARLPGAVRVFAGSGRDALREGDANWNGDQGHHFAAFFQYGYKYGGAAGSIGSAVFELLQAALGSVAGKTLNMGDVQLGIDAALMGASLHSGPSQGEIGQHIRDKLDQH